jgi:hypothetical protein
VRSAIRLFSACFVVVGTGVVDAPRAAAQDADACIAANDRAVSMRKTGKLIDARKALSTCASSTCPDPVRSSCQQRLADALRAIPSIVFEVKDADGSDVTAVKIGMDGQPLADRAAGTAIEVDPGEHDFTFEVAGHTPVHKRIVVVEAVKERHEVVALGRPEAPPANPPKQATPVPPQPEEGGGSSQKTIGLVIAGVGVAGIAVGGVFGLMASSSWSSAQKECGSPSQCPQYGQAVNDQQSASSSAAVSTIAFVGGGVALAAGLALFLTAPKSDKESAQAAAALSVAPTVGPGGGGLVFKGGF